MKRAEAGPSPLNKSEYSAWLYAHNSVKNAKEYKRLSSSAPSRALRGSLTGDVYKMPKQDYDQLVDWLKEHHSSLSPTYTSDGKQLKRNIQTPADFIDFAFKENQQKNIETVECKDGHILALSYNWNYKLLMVRFKNEGREGNVVVFFNLPANTAATLMIHGKNNDMEPSPRDGSMRHSVGVKFWNLVRVRGTLHGTQYPFQYTEDFRSGNPSGRTVGVGPDGKPSKYIYKSDVELLDKRRSKQRNDYDGVDAVDDISDERAIKRRISEKNPARFSRENFEAFQQKEADALESDRLSHAGRVEDLADIKDYFDDDILSEDRDNPNIDSDALDKAFSMYDDTANDVELAKVAHDIKDILIKAGVTYFNI